MLALVVVEEALLLHRLLLVLLLLVGVVVACLWFVCLCKLNWFLDCCAMGSSRRAHRTSQKLTPITPTQLLQPSRASRAATS